jgi:PDZ domain-containing protein
MPRRAVVLLVSGLLCVVLAAACLFIPVPYAAIAPGPTFNALGDAGGKPIVGITGHATAATDGQLRLVTIQAYGKPQRLMVGDILRGWLDSSIAVVPIDDVFPETQTTQQQDEQGAQQMLDSQLEAKVAALSALHIPMTVVVKDTQSASPAAKVLKAGDEIVSVDGTPIDTITALTKAIGATVFLVPHSNCPDIKTVPAGLELVDVANFANALADLATLRSGGTPPGCAAP